MTEPTPYEAYSQHYAQQIQRIADLERTAERFFYRANAMLNTITEEMIMNDLRQTMCRSNVARACTEAASYARHEALALRNALSTE